MIILVNMYKMYSPTFFSLLCRHNRGQKTDSSSHVHSISTFFTNNEMTLNIIRKADTLVLDLPYFNEVDCIRFLHVNRVLSRSLLCLRHIYLHFPQQCCPSLHHLHIQWNTRHAREGLSLKKGMGQVRAEFCLCDSFRCRASLTGASRSRDHTKQLTTKEVALTSLQK